MIENESESKAIFLSSLIYFILMFHFNILFQYFISIFYFNILFKRQQISKLVQISEQLVPYI
jgi:hypothetical protein